MAVPDRELRVLCRVMEAEGAQDHDSAARVVHFAVLRRVEAPQISTQQPFLPQPESLVVAGAEEARGVQNA